MYNSGTPATDNHDLIKGFQKFQGAAGQTYTMDGIAITQEHFLEVFNSARFGGMLGLLEKTARLSTQVTVVSGSKTIGTYPNPDAIPEDIQGLIASNDASAYMSNNWAINLAMIPPGQQDDNQAKCDSRLAGIFGGKGAYAATAYDEIQVFDWINNSLIRRPPSRQDRMNVGNERPIDGVMHLYRNKTDLPSGTPGDGNQPINAFTPKGFNPKYTVRLPSDENVSDRNILRLYYEPGSLKRYGYSGGLIISFNHIGPTAKDGTPLFPNINSKEENEAGSVPIGTIGNEGGRGVGGFNNWYGKYGSIPHIHMIFYKWAGLEGTGKRKKPVLVPYTKDGKPNQRIDPRSVFCRDLGF